MAIFRYLVDDVDRAVTFYVGSLGFEEVERYGPAMAIVAAATSICGSPARSAPRHVPCPTVAGRNRVDGAGSW